MGDKLEVVRPHVAPTCRGDREIVSKGGVRVLVPGTPVRRGAIEEEKRRLRLLAIADDVVVRLGRVGWRLPHDPSSSRWRRHLRLIGDNNTPRRQRRRRLGFGSVETHQCSEGIVGLTDIVSASGPRGRASRKSV